MRDNQTTHLPVALAHVAGLCSDRPGYSSHVWRTGIFRVICRQIAVPILAQNRCATMHFDRWRRGISESKMIF